MTTTQTLADLSIKRIELADKMDAQLEARICGLTQLCHRQMIDLQFGKGYYDRFMEGFINQIESL